MTELQNSADDFVPEPLNRASRYHVLLQAVQAAAVANPAVATQAGALVARYERKLSGHRAYIQALGEDLPEIRQCRWS